MDPVLTLICLSLAMLLGCYLSGIMPIAFNFSEDKLKLVTVLGAGLLVGTSLAVIIPEGVHTMYAAQIDTHHISDDHHHHIEAPAIKSLSDIDVKPGVRKLAHEDVVDADAPVKDKHSEVSSDHQHAGMDTHRSIGLALVVGFVFMLLVDQIGGAHMHSFSTDTETNCQGQSHNRNKITATLGLVVHAAADGVALGAAVVTKETDVTMIVFVAIMLHKAPAAFGLVSFLLHDGFDRSRVRRHLLIFSLSAPVLAVITYFILSLQSTEVVSMKRATGIAMLFSAGTFLYVATVHVLPEVANMGHSRQTSADGTVVIREQKGFRKIELLTMVAGAFIPVLLSLGHKH